MLYTPSTRRPFSPPPFPGRPSIHERENGLFSPPSRHIQCPPHRKNLWRPRTPAPSRQSVGTCVQSPYMHTYLPIYRGSPRQPGPKEHDTLISADRPQQQGQQQQGQQKQKQGTRPPHIQSCDKITPAVPGRVVWFVYAMHRRIGISPISHVRPVRSGVRQLRQAHLAPSAIKGPLRHSGVSTRPLTHQADRETMKEREGGQTSFVFSSSRRTSR